MSQYLTNLTLSFGAPALLIGVLAVFAASLHPDRRNDTKGLFWGAAVGLLGGVLLSTLVAPGVSLTELTTTVRVALVVVAVLQLALLIAAGPVPALRPAARLMILVLAALLAAQAAFDFLERVAEQSLSVTRVLNTELILNIGAISVGLGVIGFLSFMAARMVSAMPRLHWPLYLILLGMLLLQWVGDAMLGMLQLDMLELTRARLSFVGKVTNFSWVFTYVAMGLAALLCVMFFRKRTRMDADARSLPSPERRKLKSRTMRERRWLRAGTASLLFLTSSMLYFDLYASRPPTLSEARPVTADSEGLIKIPVEAVDDGSLHRFAYVTEDGRLVRFFVINVLASRDRTRMSAVYDACMICGDDGYIQDGNDVVCIACNVRVFVPSIGKAGGCNPIPFPWEQDATHMIIATAELAKGAKYFSEVVEVEVQDPITGKTLINLEAPHQYDFRGKTFYFEGEGSYEQFKADPLQYADDTEQRHFRAEGWKQ